MCITSSEIRSYEEERILSLLCESCYKKVELKCGNEYDLFDFEISEYSFCNECSKAIDEFYTRYCCNCYKTFETKEEADIIEGECKECREIFENEEVKTGI